MKKYIAVALLLCCAACAFAGAFTFKSFELMPNTPLYKETIADPYGLTTKVYMQHGIDSENLPGNILVATRVYDSDGNYLRGEYIELPYSDSVHDHPEVYSNFVHMRTGTAVSLFRFNFEAFQVEVTLAGAINTVFNSFANSLCLGFDGTYVIGANVNVSDIVTVRAGIHHFSGHYGDEVIDDFLNYNDIDLSTGIIHSKYLPDDGLTYRYQQMIEYVRDSSYIIGVQGSPVEGLLVYGELECPMHKVWLRPFADAPAGSLSPSDKILLESVGTKEGFNTLQRLLETSLKNEGLYNALRFHFGAEYTYSLGKWGSLVGSVDVQLHQDGQTLHRPNSYDPSNPWEVELNVDLGWEIQSVIPGRTLALTVEYQNGRVSTLDFYYQRTQNISFGVCIR